jgi:hypothetical protein
VIGLSGISAKVFNAGMFNANIRERWRAYNDCPFAPLSPIQGLFWTTRNSMPQC